MAARREWGGARRQAMLPHPDGCGVCNQLTAAVCAAGTIAAGYEASYVCEQGHGWKTWWHWHYRVDPRAVMVLIDEGECWINE